MPQLDFVIAFPQIFWLIIIFLFFYIVIVHFFLPNFIKVLRSRKQIVLENSKTLLVMETKFNSKQVLLNQTLEIFFVRVRGLLEKDISKFFSTKELFDLHSINTKVSTALYYNIIYYDVNVLNSVSLKPNFLN